MIVIEHHQAVMAHADWIIDLGPGAGHDGGRVVFEGTPADLVAARSTLTGEHLAEYVGLSGDRERQRVLRVRVHLLAGQEARSRIARERRLGGGAGSTVAAVRGVVSTMGVESTPDAGCGPGAFR